MKLKKAIYLIVLGMIGLIAFKILEANRLESAIYALKLSGLLLLIGGAWLLYPIVVARKINDTEVQLDPEKYEDVVRPSVKEQE